MQTLLVMKRLNKTDIPIFHSVVYSLFPKAILLTLFKYMGDNVFNAKLSTFAKFQQNPFDGCETLKIILYIAVPEYAHYVKKHC